MSQSFNPYAFQNSYQANNIFNMYDPEKWKKNRFMETPITAAEAGSMSNPFMQVNETYLGGPGKIPVADDGSGMHPGMESGYQPNYGVQNPIPSQITVPNSGVPQLGIPDKKIYRTPQGTPAVASGPKLTPEARQTYTGYSKSMDKTFAMAALQSAIPENQPAPEGVTGAGRKVGGGDRSSQMTPFSSALKPKEEEYPSLWRYGMGGR
jgi:hypothetical protein